MEMVFITALGVGGATVFGALLGFIFKNISHKFSDIILGFAAGVMLSASVLGLIVPSLERGGSFGIYVTITGIFFGALMLNLIDKLVPHLHSMTGAEQEAHPHINAKTDKIMLFVTAIAIHNLPEGIAAGVGFGTDNISEALTIAGGIALQNSPEGMVIIGPMLACGMTKKRTFITAALTGIVEIFGTLVGFFAVSISNVILPFFLAFAGGTMLYVISDEMIPETHAHGSERGATYSLIAGFCLMLLVDFFLS